MGHAARADESTALKVAGNLLLLADWNQTRQIARHPELYRENNPILGRHPSTRRVDIYFAGAIIGLNALDWVMPEALSDGLWFGVIVIEGIATQRNLGIGLRLRL